MSEGVFTSITRPDDGPAHPLVSRIDSCGTGAYHVGDSPDSRTMSTLADNGITSYKHRARKFRTLDFKDFNYILAMDDDSK
jgi:low molecular weight phosphotyrosine protein phosphatase